MAASLASLIALAVFATLTPLAHAQSCTITTADSPVTIQSKVQGAWDATLAMPCDDTTCTAPSCVCTSRTFDPKYIAEVTFADGSYNLTDSSTSTNYPLKLQGTASASMGCGPTCTCPSGQPSCDLSSVTGCNEACYIRTNRDIPVPARIRIGACTDGTRPALSVASGSYVAIAGGPDSKSNVDVTFEDLKFSATTNVIGVQCAYSANCTVKRSRFSTLRFGVDIPTTATAGTEFTVVDSEFTKGVHGLSVVKTGTKLRLQSENGYGNLLWGNTRGGIWWGSGHVIVEGPALFYLQGGTGTLGSVASYSATSSGIYTGVQNGEGGVNVSTATLDPLTGAFTNDGDANEGRNYLTGLSWLTVLGTGSSSGTQYLAQAGFYADKTTFAALRSIAFSGLGGTFYQNMVTGTSSTRRVTLQNIAATNYKQMYYKGTGNAYCSPSPGQLINCTTTASPVMFNPSSGICLTSDWKACSAATPVYTTPALPSPYPSDTTGLLMPPGGACTTVTASSSECANSLPCIAQTYGTPVCGQLGLNQRCEQNSDCAQNYCNIPAGENVGVCSTSTATALTATLGVTRDTTRMARNKPTLVINGSGFDDTTPANNTVRFNQRAVGTVTAATSTQLTVSLTTPPISSGSLTAIVTNNSGNSGSTVQVATLVAVRVYRATASLAPGSTTITLNGSGFDPIAANNTVTFNNGVVGTVTSATATQLTVTLTKPPTNNGSLTAVVGAYGGDSGSPVQVATVAATPRRFAVVPTR